MCVYLNHKYDFPRIETVNRLVCNHAECIAQAYLSTLIVVALISGCDKFEAPMVIMGDDHIPTVVSFSLMGTCQVSIRLGKATPRHMSLQPSMGLVHIGVAEEPVEILEREFKKLKRSRIAIVKVRWNSKRGPEFTWEREDQMKLKYPHLFSDVSS
ncbi:hypothetical protein Tco_0285080 [Tanacetum coccineum]